ncbi:hypothetical protein CR513_45763, partial [Mucuna pruriens]
MNKGFWKNILTYMRSSFSLIKTLCMVNSYEKPIIGFISNEIDNFKKKINSYEKPIIGFISNEIDNFKKKIQSLFNNATLPFGKLLIKFGTINYICLSLLLIIILTSHCTVTLNLKLIMKVKSVLVSPLGLVESLNVYFKPKLQNVGNLMVMNIPNCKGMLFKCILFRCILRKKNCLQQKIMTDIVFVMTNSRLNEKKDVKKAYDENILVEAIKDANRGCGASVNDLEVPPIVDDDEGGEDFINEDEDHTKAQYTFILIDMKG